MVKVEELQCWKCGASLEYLLLPLSRSAECKACEAKLHVCRMCRFHDPRVAKQCREPVAEEVKDKERPNFCDYLELTPGVYEKKDTSAAAASQSELQALFGLDEKTDTDAGLDAADQSRQALDELFDLDNEKKSE